MSTTDDPTLQGGTPPSPPLEPSGHISADDYNAAVQRAARYEAALSKLDPHAERIKLLMEDPDMAQVFDDAVSAVTTMRERQKPQLSPGEEVLNKRLSKIEEIADGYIRDREEAKNAPQREYEQKWNSWINSPANERFYQRIVADHPDLKKRDLQYLSEVAAEMDFAPLEDVWKAESWRFERTRSTPPPTSLRSGSGEPETPGGSKPPSGPTMRDRIIELETARRRTA